MLKRVSAILWRRCNQATFDSMNGHSAGQYDIRLARSNFEKFFVGLPHTGATELGGYDVVVPMQSFTGPGSVPVTSVTVRFMGEQSARKDWNIPSQRPETAYPLWRRGRGIGTSFSAQAREYMVMVRDVDGNYHARWIKDSDFSKLPREIQAILTSREVGWAALS